MFTRPSCIILSLCFFSISLAGVDLATKVIADKSIRQGLWVYVGEISAADAEALSQDGGNLVQCLLPDEKSLAKFRKEINAAGVKKVYGRVLPPKGLPYVDNLINCLIIGDLPSFFKQQGNIFGAVRVTAPYGKIFLGKGSSVKFQLDMTHLKDIKHEGGITIMTKAYPKEMDEWTHFEHDSGRSSKSQDKIAGFPKGVRWLDGEFWVAYPVFGSANAAFVSSGGRNFYWIPDGSGKNWRKSRLTCRDAFNGLPLWSIKMRDTVNSNDIIADGDALFLASAMRGLKVLDGATGKEIRQIKEKGSQILYHAGCMAILGGVDKLRVVDGQSGQLLWKKDFKSKGNYYYGLDRMLLGDGKLFIVHQDSDEAWMISCFELKSGKTLWTSKPGEGLKAEGALNEWFTLTTYVDGLLLAVNGSRRMKFDEKYGQKGKAVNYVIDAGNGKLLSKYVFQATGHGGHGTNIFYFDGLVWSKTQEAWVGWDPKTGKESRRTKVAARTRCYPDHILDNLVMTDKMHFADLKSGNEQAFLATRSACGSGFFPANGMVYTFPTRCSCFRMIRGYTALPPKSALSEKAEAKLLKGPAYGVKLTQQSGQDDWPTYRGNNERGAFTDAVLASSLKSKWQIKLGEPIAAPVVSDGKVYVALMNTNRLLAIDAVNGKTIWSYSVGGRIDSPPTISGNLVLFGSHDGWVYCLNAKDGKLVWKFRGAPSGRQMLVRGQLESVWPVPGSILVQGGVAYFCAGRHTYTDNGIFYYALKADSGKLIWQVNKQAKDGSTIADIPSTDSKVIYFNSNFMLDPKAGKALPAGAGMVIYAPHSMTVDNTSFDVRGGGDNRRNQWQYADRSHAKAKSLSTHTLKEDFVQKKGIAGSLVAFNGNKCYAFYQDKDTPTSLSKRVDGKGWDQKELPPRAELRLTSLLAAKDKLFVGGITKDGKGKIAIFAENDGEKIGEIDLPSGIRWDGLAVAGKQLFVSGADGTLTCLAE